MTWKPIFIGATVTKKCAIFKSLTGTIYSMTIKGQTRRTKRPDPIDGLGRVGQIQEDLDPLLGSDLAGILVVLGLLSNTSNMSEHLIKLLLILTVQTGTSTVIQERSSLTLD